MPGLVCLLAVLAGCGSGSPTPTTPRPPEPEPRGTGYFVGTGPDRLGASLDLLAEDRTTRALSAALAGEPGTARPTPVVGIASVVNGGEVAAPTPRFTAILDSGGAAPLASAREALAGRDDPLARRALARLPPQRAVVAGGASALLYVVLEGAGPREVASARMTAMPGRPIVLEARPR